MHAALAAPPSPSAKNLSFSPSVLSDPDFNPQSFISTIRTKTPLSVVRDDLRQHISHLQAELVSCVQRDFQTYISFGDTIRDADALATAISQPLKTLRSNIVALVTALDDQIDQLHQTLSLRRQTAATTNALTTLIDANDLLLKCERLLREYTALPQSLDALRLAERIAGESAQLSFVLSRAAPGPFLSSISVRISAVRRSVRTCLEAWLRRALFPPDAPADALYDNHILARVLTLYVVSGLVPEAEAFFRREIVAPFAATRLRMTPMLAVAERNAKNRHNESRRDALPAQSPPAVTAADALQAAEGEIINFLGEKVMPIVSLVDAEERLRTRLDFVGRAVWPQIARAISSHMAASFSPGIPDVFHQSVRAGSRLYAAIEAAVTDEAHRDALRKCSATTDFWKHWNLPVYFQLRFQDVTTKFDASLKEGPVSVDASTSVQNNALDGGSMLLRTDVYNSAPTVSLVASLRRCWSEEVFLKSLTHRFLRLSLQLLARYSTWVRTGLAGEWTNVDAVPKGAVRIFYDITVLQKRIPAELSSVLRLRAPSLSPEILDSLDATFTEAVETYSSLLPDLSRSISDALARSCVENLQPLRGILATYRMSSKQAPTTHSSFVPKILRPLKSFMSDNERTLQLENRIEIATAVIEQTTAEYFNMATDLLQRNRSSAAALKRLNIGRGGAFANRSSSSSNVTEKISMQLYLDVAKFMDETKALGVSADSVPSIGRLWDSVKRDETPGNATDSAVDEVLETAAENQYEPDASTADSGSVLSGPTTVVASAETDSAVTQEYGETVPTTEDVEEESLM